MSKIFLHLTSPTPTAFCVNDSQIGFTRSPCDYLSLCVEQEDFILYVHPLENSCPSLINLSYSSLISCLPSHPLSSSNLITITDYGHHHFVLSAKPLLTKRHLPPTSCCVKTAEFSANLINNSIYLTSPKHSFCMPLTHTLKKPTLTQKNSNLIFSATTEEDKTYCLVFNSNLHLLLDCLTDKLELTDSHLITLDNAGDIACHGIVHDYTLSSSAVSLTSTHTAYLKNSPIPPATPLALPYALLEAIKLNNLTLARTYLHPSLSSVLSDYNLTGFFGDFLFTTPGPFDEPEQVVLTYKANPCFTKRFKFEIKNNLIFNIDYME